MRKRPVILRIGAVLIASFFIFLCLEIVFAVYGNPIYFQRSWYTAKEYIEKHYPDSDYVIEEIGHSWNGGGYHAKINSPTKRDEHFYIYMDSYGGYHFSDDERYIGRKIEMKSRLSGAYNQAFKSAIVGEEIYPYHCSAKLVFDHYDLGLGLTSYSYQAHEDIEVLRELPLNISEYQESYGEIGGCLVVSLETEDATVEMIVDILLQTKEMAVRNGVLFHAVQVELGKPTLSKTPTQVVYFLKENIYEEGLLERVQEAREELKAFYKEMGMKSWLETMEEIE